MRFLVVEKFYSEKFQTDHLAFSARIITINPTIAGGYRGHVNKKVLIMRYTILISGVMDAFEQERGNGQ